VRASLPSAVQVRLDLRPRLANQSLPIVLFLLALQQTFVLFNRKDDDVRLSPAFDDDRLVAFHNLAH
jgi:hypothetical protein